VDLAGRTVAAVASRTATAGPCLRDGADTGHTVAAPAFSAAGSPADGAVSLRRYDLDLARSAGVRTRPALRLVALPGAYLFPGGGAAVLVPGSSPVSCPPTLVALAAAAVSVSGGSLQYRTGGTADLLRSSAVPLLHRSAATDQHLAAG